MRYECPCGYIYDTAKGDPENGIAPKLLPLGGTAMYALLALAGDVGCSAGPTLVGFVSGACGDNLKIGILTACIFPLLILVCLFKGKLGKETA